MFKKEEFGPGSYCPYSQERCRKGECALWVVLTGENPNTGQPMNEGKCSHHWQVILAVEGNKNSYQVGAAVESFRNEMSRQNQESKNMLVAIAARNQARLKDEDVISIAA